MTIGKHDFNKEAALWDEQPIRIRLANDVCSAISANALLNTTMNALDFGCGTGLLTLRLAPLVGFITGIDSSRGMVDILRGKIAKQNLANVGGLLLDLDAGDTLTGNYDIIASSMTFHHIEKIAPILSHFHRCLSPGGYLCIADLDPEYGLFHDASKAVFHFGFERTVLGNAIGEAGFNGIKFTTATEVIKPAPDGKMVRFSIFLMTAQKGGKA